MLICSKQVCYKVANSILTKVLIHFWQMEKNNIRNQYLHTIYNHDSITNINYVIRVKSAWRRYKN